MTYHIGHPRQVFWTSPGDLSIEIHFVKLFPPNFSGPELQVLKLRSLLMGLIYGLSDGNVLLPVLRCDFPDAADVVWPFAKGILEDLRIWVLEQDLGLRKSMLESAVAADEVVARPALQELAEALESRAHRKLYVWAVRRGDDRIEPFFPVMPRLPLATGAVHLIRLVETGALHPAAAPASTDDVAVQGPIAALVYQAQVLSGRTPGLPGPQNRIQGYQELLRLWRGGLGGGAGPTAEAEGLLIKQYPTERAQRNLRAMAQALRGACGRRRYYVPAWIKGWWLGALFNPSISAVTLDIEEITRLHRALPDLVPAWAPDTQSCDLRWVPVAPASLLQLDGGSEAQLTTLRGEYQVRGDYPITPNTAWLAFVAALAYALGSPDLPAQPAAHALRDWPQVRQTLLHLATELESENVPKEAPFEVRLNAVAGALGVQFQIWVEVLEDRPAYLPLAQRHVRRTNAIGSQSAPAVHFFWPRWGFIQWAQARQGYDVAIAHADEPPLLTKFRGVCQGTRAQAALETAAPRTPPARPQPPSVLLSPWLSTPARSPEDLGRPSTVSRQPLRDPGELHLQLRAYVAYCFSLVGVDVRCFKYRADVCDASATGGWRNRLCGMREHRLLEDEALPDPVCGYVRTLLTHRLAPFTHGDAKLLLTRLTNLSDDLSALERGVLWTLRQDKTRSVFEPPEVSTEARMAQLAVLFALSGTPLAQLIPPDLQADASPADAVITDTALADAVFLDTSLLAWALASATDANDALANLQLLYKDYTQELAETTGVWAKLAVSWRAHAVVSPSESPAGAHPEPKINVAAYLQAPDLDTWLRGESPQELRPYEAAGRYALMAAARDRPPSAVATYLPSQFQEALDVPLKEQQRIYKWAHDALWTHWDEVAARLLPGPMNLRVVLEALAHLPEKAQAQLQAVSMADLPNGDFLARALDQEGAEALQTDRRAPLRAGPPSLRTALRALLVLRANEADLDETTEELRKLHKAADEALARTPLVARHLRFGIPFGSLDQQKAYLQKTSPERWAALGPVGQQRKLVAELGALDAVALPLDPVARCLLLLTARDSDAANDMGLWGRYYTQAAAILNDYGEGVRLGALREALQIEADVLAASQGAWPGTTDARALALRLALVEVSRTLRERHPGYRLLRCVAAAVRGLGRAGLDVGITWAEWKELHEELFSRGQQLTLSPDGPAVVEPDEATAALVDALVLSLCPGVPRLVPYDLASAQAPLQLQGLRARQASGLPFLAARQRVAEQGSALVVFRASLVDVIFVQPAAEVHGRAWMTPALHAVAVLRRQVAWTSATDNDTLDRHTKARRYDRDQQWLKARTTWVRPNCPVIIVEARQGTASRPIREYELVEGLPQALGNAPQDLTRTPLAHTSQRMAAQSLEEEPLGHPSEGPRGILEQQDEPPSWARRLLLTSQSDQATGARLARAAKLDHGRMERVEGPAEEDDLEDRLIVEELYGMPDAEIRALADAGGHEKFNLATGDRRLLLKTYKLMQRKEARQVPQQGYEQSLARQAALRLKTMREDAMKKRTAKTALLTTKGEFRPVLDLPSTLLLQPCPAHRLFDRPLIMDQDHVAVAWHQLVPLATKEGTLAPRHAFAVLAVLQELEETPLWVPRGRGLPTATTHHLGAGEWRCLFHPEVVTTLRRAMEQVTLWLTPLLDATGEAQAPPLPQQAPLETEELLGAGPPKHPSPRPRGGQASSMSEPAAKLKDWPTVRRAPRDAGRAVASALPSRGMAQAFTAPRVTRPPEVAHPPKTSSQPTVPKTTAASSSLAEARPPVSQREAVLAPPPSEATTAASSILTRVQSQPPTGRYDLSWIWTKTWRNLARQLGVVTKEPYVGHRSEHRGAPQTLARLLQPQRAVVRGRDNLFEWLEPWGRYFLEEPHAQLTPVCFFRKSTNENIKRVLGEQARLGWASGENLDCGIYAALCLIWEPFMYLNSRQRAIVARAVRTVFLPEEFCEGNPPRSGAEDELRGDICADLRPFLLSERDLPDDIFTALSLTSGCDFILCSKRAAQAVASVSEEEYKRNRLQLVQQGGGLYGLLTTAKAQEERVEQDWQEYKRAETTRKAEETREGRVTNEQFFLQDPPRFRNGSRDVFVVCNETGGSHYEPVYRQDGSQFHKSWNRQELWERTQWPQSATFNF